jgi:hypothetical protein
MNSVTLAANPKIYYSTAALTWGERKPFVQTFRQPQTTKKETMEIAHF